MSKAKEAGFDKDLWHDALVVLSQLLAPFAPHIASEMLCELDGADARMEKIDWPKWDDKYLTTDTMKIAIQVNGKLRGDVEVAKDATEDDVKSAAAAVENVARFIGDKTPARIIYVPGKIVNIVVK